MAKPDFTLKIKARDGKYATRVGAAWRNKAGGINIKLDPLLTRTYPLEQINEAYDALERGETARSVLTFS